ncbi:MAG: dihydrolipoamide acetyltransferase family protein [Chloroherpetonaceae bacterium]|nr:2-oxo acid dehydrogenase subunit E2 [Chthonomonadaceae bacterium]MDW8208681.1 dihydrolipoamide acetyltransferase family protein [Chloroherpetonaceae bacterium]
MAHLFTMPQLGSTMEEGTILRWHKREGDPVKAGEVLLEIETDKSTMEVEAPTDGVLRKILEPENALVPIRKPIAVIGSADEPVDHLLTGAQTPDTAEPASRSADPGAPMVEAASIAGEGERIAISPRASRLAAEKGVPVTALAGRGTGIGGRIVERDVLAYLETQSGGMPTVEMAPERVAPRLTPLAARLADDLGVAVEELATGLPGSRVRSTDVIRHVESRKETPAPVLLATEGPGYTAQPFTGMRRRIAENVSKSAFTAPHVTLTLEVDMTACAALRAQLIPAIEASYGARLSFTDLLVKAVARALEAHPQMNASLIGEELRIYQARNIGVAVALDDGLVVPVVRDADRKTVGAIAAELKQLVERARAGQCTPEELSGGTFTITNLGAFGIDLFDPILVPGQVGILGVGRIAEKPVVVQGEVAIRSMMHLCLSFDHRVVDGAPAARFLQSLKELLEQPLSILV